MNVSFVKILCCQTSVLYGTCIIGLLNLIKLSLHKCVAKTSIYMLAYGALIPLVEEIQLENSHFVFNKDLALDQQLNILFSSALQNFNRLKYAGKP